MNCKHCCIACGVISFDSVTTVMGCCTPFAFSVCKMFLTVIRWFFARVLVIKILTIHIRIFWKAGWFSSLVAPLVFLWLSTVGSTWKLDRRLSCSQTLQCILFVCARSSCFHRETKYTNFLLQKYHKLCSVATYNVEYVDTERPCKG